MTRKATKSDDQAQPVIAVKGFDKNLQCRGFQFELEKTYTHEGNVEKCASGFHACENPLDVFGYYSPVTSRFALVELSGELSREESGDSKIAAGSITIKGELKIPTLVDMGVKWILSKTTDTKVESNTGDQSAATNTGDQSAATNTGYRSAATNTGYGSVASVSCTGAVAMSIGYRSSSSAGVGGAIVCVYLDDDFNLIHIRASKVGENGIEPGIAYTLDADGNFAQEAQS
jgi:hypothetical protein